MMCPALFAADRKENFGDKVDVSRFDRLTIRNIVVGWKEKARAAHEPFESFMFAWLAFNGWGACVTAMDRDRDIVDSLSLNGDLCARFADMIAKSADAGQAASGFYEMWPFFSVTEMNRKDVTVTAARRESQIQQLLAHSLAPAGPRCWLQHKDAAEVVPLDWQHILAAIYCVRNNLFHGNKASDSESDLAIVAAAYETLMHFIEEANLF